MPSLTVENYLKAILTLEATLPRRGKKSVATGKIAEALGVAPGTVTAMIKTLESGGLVRYRKYGGVLLTPQGRALALHVLRRHRIVELFLVEILGMNWAEVHEEAEALEHTVSKRVLEHMDALLGHPTVDPHGDPIPQATGQVAERYLSPLVDAEPGKVYILARLLDQSAKFLTMAEQLNLRPGIEITVTSRDDQRQILHLSVKGQEVAVSGAAASKIAVSPVAEPSGASRQHRKRPGRSTRTRK